MIAVMRTRWMTALTYIMFGGPQKTSVSARTQRILSASSAAQQLLALPDSVEKCCGQKHDNGYARFEAQNFIFFELTDTFVLVWRRVKYEIRNLRRGTHSAAE